MSLRILAVGSVLFLSACVDARNPLQPDVLGPDLATLDGAHGGNQAFFFLPPLLPEPTTSGVFDPAAEPEVEICSVVDDACDESVALFTMASGQGSETVRMDLDAEHYIVNWHTDGFDLNASTTYRIVVRLGDVELGYADVDLVNNGKELKNVDTDEYIPLKDGRTLPIKFRIEEGALPGGFRWATVTGGWDHTCALSTAGAAYCWGLNAAGQVGVPIFPGNGVLLAPVAVTGGHTFQDLDAGVELTCGVTVDDEAYCWGRGESGQLGTSGPLEECIGGRVCLPSPTLVQGLHSFHDVEAWNGVCALTTADDTYCWGIRIGLVGQTTSVPELVPGDDGHAFSQLAVSGYACGLEASNEIICWGENSHGVFGNGIHDTRSVFPQPPVGGGQTFKALSSGGGFHVCGIGTDDVLYCWGYDGTGTIGQGMVGNELTWRAIAEPHAVVGGHSFTSVAAGAFHTCGVTTGGDAYCWGSNRFGQLGVDLALTTELCQIPFQFPNTATECSSTPVLVSGGLTFARLGAGLLHTCGVTTGGEIYCWGSNNAGQLGDGSTQDNGVHFSPVQVVDPM